jgi:hypothetical protein
MVRVSLALGGKKNDSSSGAPELDITRVIAIPSTMVPSVLQNGTPGGGGNVQNHPNIPTLPRNSFNGP